MRELRARPYREGYGAEPARYTRYYPEEGERLMPNENVARTLFALMAGATVGAGVGLLFAPRAGSQFRSSLREYTRRVKNQVDQATNNSTQSSDTHEAGCEIGVRKPGAEGGGRSATKDHTIGDTGQDN